MPTYEQLYTARLEKIQELRRLRELIRQSEDECTVIQSKLDELDALAYGLGQKVQ